MQEEVDNSLEWLRLSGWSVFITASSPSEGNYYHASAHPTALYKFEEKWAQWVAYGRHQSTLADAVASLCAMVRLMGQRDITGPPLAATLPDDIPF